MAEQEGQQVKIQPDDPEYQLQEHIAFKHRLESLNIQLRKLFQANLSQFRLIMDGSTFAFTKLSLANRGIVQVSQVICDYPHLRIAELNSNRISEIIHIQKLRYLVQLNLSRNIISDGRFLSNNSCFPFLKSLNLSFNKFKQLPNVQLENLIHLNLNGNEISTLQDFDGHPKLQILQLRGNKLASLKGLEKIGSLRQLYLADNSISSLNGLNHLPQLQKLHLRKNKIVEMLEFPKISIKYLNLRENQISKIASLAGVHSSVAILNLLANPISEELGDNAKKEIWMKFRNYQKINKVEVTQQQKEQFDKEYKERLAEQQRQQKEARQAKQQAQREAAEAAEKDKQE